jgi:hypothetical protein
VLALGATVARTSALEEVRPSEYQVKAAFIYNFAKFVEWPADRPIPEDEPFVITVLGQDPFGGVLDESLRGKSVAGRQVKVRRVTRTEEVGHSEILFISDSEGEQLPRILKQFERDAVLTVGEMDGFAERGGVIRFKTEKDRVRLEINVGVAERARLRISSELLKLARIVRQAPGG